MPITNYDLIFDKPKNPGQPTTFGARDIYGFFSEETVIVPMGLGLVYGSNPDSCKFPTADTETFAGISYYSDTFEQEDGISIDANNRYGYPVGRKVSLIVKSVSPVVVYVDSATNLNDPVFIRFAVGSGSTQLGVFRNDADTASAFQLPIGRFVETVTAPPPGETKLSSIVIGFS